MKKQYIIPSVTVVQFEMSDIMTTSLGGGYSNQGTGVSDAGAPNRRNAIWDE